MRPIEPGRLGTAGASRSSSLAALLAAAVLAGCASSPSGPGGRSAAALGAPVVAAAELLIGDYAGLSWLEGESASRVGMRIEPLAVTAQAAALELSQRDAGGSVRRFRLTLQEGSMPSRLDGAFEPLDSQGAAIGRCPLEVVVRPAGVLARTDPASCRFGDGENALGLLKEIGHDGRRLLIVDRIVGPVDQPDRSLELRPVQSWSGWSGRRDGDSGPWRMARAFLVDSDGGVVVPVDAAGMELGVELDLGLHRISADGPTVLRLRVFDRAGGALLGQTWADPEATRLGIALGELQIGLELESESDRARSE